MKNEKNYSREHLLYLRSVKKKSAWINVSRVAILICLLGIWELSAQLLCINPFITSSPSRIFKTVAELSPEEHSHH